MVAAALILPVNTQIESINDSKKLHREARQILYNLITENAVAYGIGLADVQEIDRLNIVQATFLAMKRAVDGLNICPEYLLIDGRDFPRFFFRDDTRPLLGRALIGGDGLSGSVAGASILAKVYRDRLMETFAEKYPQYGFEKHKGYGTRAHRECLASHGPCPIHRKSFIRKITSERLL